MLTCNQEGGVGRESRLSMPGFGPVGGAVGERVSVVRSGSYPPASFDEVCRAGAIYCCSVWHCMQWRGCGSPVRAWLGARAITVGRECAQSCCILPQFAAGVAA